jgi:hypothetical protein
MVTLIMFIYINTYIKAASVPKIFKIFFISIYFLLSANVYSNAFSIQPYADAGSFQIVIDRTTGPNGQFTLYYPKNISHKSPILTWGNGTGMKPTRYDEFLKHLATHGITVIASLSSNTGTGKEMLQGITWLISENNNVNSPFYQTLDTNAIGAFGHSQGGAGTLRAASDIRVKASAPLHPTGAPVSGLIGPALFITGSKDTIVSPKSVKQLFEATTVPAVFGNKIGAGHTASTGNAGATRGYVTAWFKWQLEGDTEASRAFLGKDCGLCTDPDWKVIQHY